MSFWMNSREELVANLFNLLFAVIVTFTVIINCSVSSNLILLDKAFFKFYQNEKRIQCKISHLKNDHKHRH